MTAKWLGKDVVLKVYFPKTLEFALAQTGMRGVFGSLNVAQITCGLIFLKEMYPLFL